MERGKRIVIEGTDATGKSDAASAVADGLAHYGLEVLRWDEPDSIRTRNPDPYTLGEPLVPISIELRKISKNGDLGKTAMTELLLNTASRIEGWEVASKWMAEGGWVSGSRSFLSSHAFQGFGAGLSFDFVRTITRKHMDAIYMNPDLNLILDMEDEQERAERMAARGPLENPDAYEQQDAKYQTRVREGYRYLAKRDNIPIIEASPPFPEVISNIWPYVQRLDPHRLGPMPDEIVQVYAEKQQ